MDEELNAPLAEQDQEQAQAASNLLSDPITVSADDFAKARQYSADNDVPLTTDPETLKRLARTFDMVPPDVQRSPAMRGIIADAMYYGLAKDRLKELNEVAKEIRRQADEKRYEEQSRYQKDYRPYAFLGSLEKGFQNIVYKNATLAKGLFKDWLYNLPINSENGEEIDTSSFEPLRKKWADESTRETAADMGAIAAEQMSNPLPPRLNAVYDELNEKGKTISGGISVILEHPSEMAALAAQSVASVVPQVALTVAGGVLGGPAGAMAAAGLASGVVDYLSEVSQRVEEDYYKNGGKMDTPPDEAWIQFFNNPEKRAELEKLAALHALPVSVLDALSAGLAGRFVSAAVRSSAKTGHAGLKVGTAAAGELAVQAGLGAGGEALGQILSEGQVKDVAGVWLEGIAEVFGAPFEARGTWRSYMDAADRYNFFDKAQRVSEAFRFNDAMRVLSEKVKATGMKERHAEDVTAKVVQDTAGEDAVVYVDAEGLEQDGIAEIAKEASPTVREQYDKAREQGGNIEVPLGEYAATLGALDQSDLIHQNAKANPDGMTAKEATAQAEALADNYESAITAARKAYDAASAAADEAAKADDAFKMSNPNAAPDAVASSKARAGEAVDEALKARGQVEALEREARAVLGEEGFQKLEEKLNAKEEPAEDVGIREFAKNLRQSERVVAKNIYDTIKQFGKWKPDTAKFLAVAFARIAAILGERDGGKTAEEFMSRGKPLQILAEKVGQDTGLYPERAGKPRGSLDTEEMIMRLAKSADVSTFMHESAHYFLELYAIAVQDIAQRAQAGETLTQGEQSLLNDFATAMRWAGMTGEDADIVANFSSMPVDEKRPYHEKFARGFEAYLFEGKAPSENSRLKNMFRAFASWLKAIYRSLTKLGVELNDDIRGVFDRMFASEAEILATRRAREQGALFKTREEGGMTEAEWEAYRDMNTETALSAVETMRRKALSDMRFARLLRRQALDELTQEQRRAYKFFEDQARQEVMSEPVSRAWVWLTNKITGADRMRNAKEGNAAAGEGRRTNAGRLEEASVRGVLSQYEDGEAIFNVLRQRGFLRKREGVTVADAITLMGDRALSEQYDTSEEDGAYRFLRAMAAIRDPEQRVKAKVERRMLEEFSQLASAKAVGEEADILVHSPIAARFAESEAKALERLNGTARSLKRDAKAAAEDAVRSIQLKRLLNRKYAKECAKNAEKYGKEARKRYGGTDLAGAAEAMRLKAFNTAMVDQAVRTEDRIRRDLKDLLRFTSKNFKLHQVNLRLIHKILARFGFMPEALMIEPSVVEGDTSLAQWRQDAQNLGFDVPMDDLVLDEFNRAGDYTNLSVEDFYAVHDAVMTIYAQGKVMETNYLKGKAQKNAETATDLAESARENADPKRAGTPAGLPSALETAKRGFTAAKYWLLKASTIFYVLDGGKENGEFMKTFMYSADERTAWEAQKRADTMKVIQDILAPMQTLTGLDLKKTYVPSTGMSFTKENAFIAVANMGNVQNIKRLLDGFGWEKEQLLDIARLLTKDELLRVQRVWDVFESFVPDIARMSLRVDGHEPEWVKPQPITVMSADGQEVTLKGGYFPIQYDIKAKSFFHLTEEEAKAADTGYIAATTRRTYMKKRKDDVGLGHPVLLSFTTLTKGLNEVIHDLAFREWGIWAQHLWHNPVVTDAIHQAMGREGGYVVATIDGWIKDILVGDMKPQADAEKAVAALRRYVAVVGLAFNVKTMLVQPLGITNTMGRIGAAYTWRGLQYFLRDPKAAMAEAYRIAPELELRTRARTRDLAEALGMIHVGGKVQQWLQNWGMAGMLRTQRWTDCATWWGAYMKAADEGHSQEDARRIANRIVDDAQGGGSVASLAAAERGGPALKLFTSFYTFFGATVNTFMGQWATNANSMSERFALWCFCIAIPAIAESILTALVTPSDADDPWDDLPSDIVADLIQYHLSLAPIVRELTDVGRGIAATATGGKGPRRPYGYSGPAGTRLIKELNDLAYMASSGKFDERFVKTLATVTGLLTGMVPAAQLNRTIKGMNAMMEGETENPLALVFGMERTKRKRKTKPRNEF